MDQATNEKKTLGWLKLRYDTVADSSASNEGPQLQFDVQVENALSNSFRSQLWISALAASIVWQQPWLSVKWTIIEAPPGDVSGNGAALAIALIATASGVDYPQDTVVLGRLNPDGSLGLVIDAASRVKTAAAAGIKRVVVSNLQRFEVSGQGEILNISALAEKLGMECTLVDDLIEATEVVLQKKLPSAPSIQNLPRYSVKLLTALDSKCRNEMEQLRAESKTWPRSEAQLNTFKEQEQILWKKIFVNYDLSIDAYSAGQLYIARRFMRQAHAYLCGLEEIKIAGNKFDYKSFDERGNAIRKKMTDRMSNPSLDKNELQSALVLAEESDWIYRLSASVEGAQIIARQAFGVQSDASAQQKTLARIHLISAVAGGEYQMKDPDFYEEIYPLLVQKEGIPIYNRALLWLPQLKEAQLGGTEFFIMGLKSRSGDFDANLLFDARLASFERLLRDKKFTQAKEDREVDFQAKEEPSEIVKIGFIPEDGYAVPKAPILPPAAQSLSDTALCLNWVNEYCEVAMLDEKYLRLGGAFDSNTLEWNVKNSAALQSMLQIADLGARRGIIFAEKVGVDTSTLDLIYEVASHLRLSEDNNLRLEALRQYWRCALLGSMCWQLGYIPRAVVDVPDAVFNLPAPMVLPTPSPIQSKALASSNSGALIPSSFIP